MLTSHQLTAAVACRCCLLVCCCGPKAAVVDAGGTELQLLRVPSAVRDLLPSKPYHAPETTNPLPGAATEPDCCSVCLAEFEQGENVTVLPCMHFYHKVGGDSGRALVLMFACWGW